MLEVNNLNVFYGAIHALKGISLTVGDGELGSLIGANGAGKTTTLHAISGLLPIASGSILLDGKDIREIPLRELRSRIGIVLQEPFLFSGTIGENIAITESGSEAAGQPDQGALPRHRQAVFHIRRKC